MKTVPMVVLGVIVPFVRVPWQMKILILSLAVIKPGVILVDVSVTVARRPTQLVQRSVIVFTVTTWTTVHAVTSVLRDVHVPITTALVIQLSQRRQLQVAVRQQLQHPRCCVRKLTLPLSTYTGFIQRSIGGKGLSKQVQCSVSDV